MTQRNKLDLEINSPTTIELLFDTPITGKSTYGPYAMYAVKVNGDEYSFFPPEEVHDQLKQLKKGDKAVITKVAAQRGSKLVTVYDVKAINQPAAIANEKEDSNRQDDSMVLKPDNLRAIMLKCYEDGLAIQRELNGLADPEKIAVTLFIARSKLNGNGYGG